MAETGEFPHEPLTRREREIVELIADGLTNQQIAARLYLTLDTVKWYNRQIYQKLGVHSRTQAVASLRELESTDASQPAPEHNLPSHGTPFIGREQELTDIQARLANPACRLLTLLGPGGIGKTRLATAAARGALGSYPDGVYFVPLAPVQSSAFVVQALADGVGLTLTNEGDALDQFVHYVRQKTALLLLDNFEHLLQAANLLGEMLARSSAVKLLVTSRERLHLQEEWVFDIQGLRYPMVGKGVGKEEESVTTLANYDAGQLFLWTAQRVKADFVPDEQDQAHVARICQLVGGMPLGIELAASWVRLLPCAEIARRIAEGMDMFTSSWRDIPERHRSIQAALDHSWRLLTVGEQAAFSKLTVFAGAFRREVAAAVADTSLTLLLALVDKSMLQRTDSERFGIHELVKQYGSEKLRDDLETWTETRLRHCRYHAALLYERMKAPDADIHLTEIESVFDDLQAAWRYAVETCQRPEIHRLAAGFLVYYRRQSWYRAGTGALEVYRQALTCFDPATANPDHRTAMACLYESLGHLYELASAHEAMLDAYRKALELTGDDNAIGRGRLYSKIADAWVNLNRLEPASECYALAESVLEAAPERDAEWWIEWLHVKTQQMDLYYWRNRPDAMAKIARRIHPLIEQHGTVTQQGRYLYLMSLMTLRQDRYLNSGDAVNYSAEALALSLKTDNLRDTAYRYFNYAFSLLWSNRFDEAEANLKIARKMTEQNGDRALLARVITYLAVVYRKRNHVERVREYADLGLAIANEANMPQYMGMARAQGAWLAWRAGDMAGAKREAEASVDHWGGLGSAQSVIPFQWVALFPLLGAALHDEELEQAVQWARRLLAPELQGLPDDLTTVLRQAVSAGEVDEWEAASDLLHQALQLAQELRYI